MKFFSARIIFGLSLAALIGCGGAQSTEEGTTTATVTTSDDPADVRMGTDRITYDGQIRFDVNSATLAAESGPLLDHIALFLSHHSQEIVQVEVVGHTDDTGSADSNLTLSSERAAAVVAALRERGVTVALDSRGAGEAERTCTEDTDACHEQNRRVEFVIRTAS